MEKNEWAGYVARTE